MKTSKKLLSFFLAVVMVVTTCSVGFTAFAKDNSNSIWNTKSEASDAFDSLNDLANTYLPSVLLGINLTIGDVTLDITQSVCKSAKYADVAKTYDELTADEKAHSWNEDGSLKTGKIFESSEYQVFDRIEKLKAVKNPTDEQKDELKGLQAKLFLPQENKKNVTIQDILLAIQPVLVQLLEKQTQQEFVNSYDTSVSGNPSVYNYLNGRTEDVDFYTLFNLCKTYRNNSNLSASTRSTLNDWYTKLESIAKLYGEKQSENEQNDAKLLKIVQKYCNGFDFQKVSLEKLENTNFDLTDDEKAFVESMYDYSTARIQSYGCDIRIDSVAKLAYYTLNAMGDYWREAFAYYNLIHKAGTTVTYVTSGTAPSSMFPNAKDFNITQDITPSNYEQLISAEILKDYNVSTVEQLAAALGRTDLEDFKSDLSVQVLMIYRNCVLAGKATNENVQALTNSPYYKDLLIGALIDSGAYSSKADVEAAVKDMMPEGFGTKDCVLTDAEIADMGAVFADAYSYFVQKSDSSFSGDYFLEGTLTYPSKANKDQYAGDDYGKTTTAKLPAVLKNSIVGEYWNIVSSSVENKNHNLDLAQAFTGGDISRVSFVSTDSKVRKLSDDGLIMCTYRNKDYIASYYFKCKNDNYQYFEAEEVLVNNGKIVSNMTDADVCPNCGQPLKECLDTETVHYFRQSTKKEVPKPFVYQLKGSERDDVYSSSTNPSVATEAFVTTHDYAKSASGMLVVANAAPSIGSKNGLDSNGNTERTTINGLIAEAEEYAYTKLAMSTLGITSFTYDEVTGYTNSRVNMQDYVKTTADKAFAKKYTTSVVLTADQLAILNGDYDLTGKLGTEIVSQILNDTVISLLESAPISPDQTVTDIVNAFLETKVDLVTALEDIWERLCDSPVQTIFELLPVLVTVVDELLVPVLFNNGDGDSSSLAGMIANSDLLKDNSLTMSTNSYIGISKLGWDLNTLIPTLMHWLQGDKNYNYTYYTQHTGNLLDKDGNTIVYKASDVDALATAKAHYVVKDADGNELKAIEITKNGTKSTVYSYRDNTNKETVAEALAGYDDAQFTASYTYESNVPNITGIYIADLALRDAKLADMPTLLSKIVTDQDTGATLGKTGEGLGEIVIELGTLFSKAVDKFLADPDLVSQVKTLPKASNFNTTSKGLNNLFVAIPQLFDIMENLAADKYSVAKDKWTYCYDGKIIPVTVETTDDKGNVTDSYEKISNSRIEEFKSYATSSASDRSVGILDTFVDVFVSDWLNSIVSLFNNVVSTNNSITKNIPIVTGLLNALGGFSEESILTDILNGVFQLDRSNDKYSFTFKERDNGFVGLSKNNAYFLITNIPRLIEVINNLQKTLSAKTPSQPSNGNNNSNTSNTSPVAKPRAAATAKADSHNYSSKELSNASDLINNLDKMLSSLLSDSSLNGFNLNKTDNILSGVVTLFSNYLGRDCYTKLGRLLNLYTYYITGEESYNPDKNGNTNAKKVYTNESLTGLVVETYQLIEDVCETLLAKFDASYALDNQTKASYNLLVEAIEGLISPDAVSARLDGYSKVQSRLSDYNCWHNAAAKTSRDKYKIYLNWGIKAGDKDAFFDALSASMRLVTSVLGVLLVDTNWYSTVVSPVLTALCSKNGIKIDTAKQYAALTNGYRDEVLLGLIRPVSDWFNLFLSKPATTLIKSLQGIAGLLDDKHGATIASVVSGALTPIVKEFDGLSNILLIKSDDLKASSPTFAKEIKNITITVNDKEVKLYNLLKTYSNAKNIKIGNGKYTYSLSGANLIPIINSYISNTGIALKQLNWYKLSTAKSPAAALTYLLEYLIETLTDSKNLKAISNLIGDDSMVGMIIGSLLEALSQQKINAQDIIKALDKILEATDSPTLAYWTFAQYATELTESFKYPAGVTKAMADAGVEGLDNLVKNIFPLLSSFGVDLGGDSLSAIINKNLFTNDILTKLATALYGALDSTDNTVKQILKSLGIVTSTKDVAKILTDKSYGKTYTAAAKAIKSKASWSKVKNVNWGFKDGSSNAQQGFINALAAILRPLNNVLQFFLNEGTLQLNDTAYAAIKSITVAETVKNITLSEDVDSNTKGNQPVILKVTYSMKNGVLTVKLRESNKNRKYSRPSTLKIDFNSLKKASDLKLVGTNGYNSVVIPILETLQCSNISTYKQYRSDVAKAKDNLLIDVLNPLIGKSSGSLLSKLVANPAETLTKLLPNLALFLNGNGIIQVVTNILAPITYAADGKNHSAEIDDVFVELLGGSVQDMIIPLVNSILAGVDNKAISSLELANINWDLLASLGTIKSYTSKATGLNGNRLIGKRVENVDNGKVLVTVLRYVANLIVDNASTLKKLITSIDAVAKNDMIKSIVTSVFNTMSTATADQIVAALFYLFGGQPQNAFWNYTEYKTGKYSFAYPDGMDTDFLKQLPPMLDGTIAGMVNLNDLITQNLFTDSLVSKLAKGLYGAIEGVKINDNLTLTQLLAQTNIDFSTSNVASLLTNETYGKTYASAASVIASAGSWANVKEDDLKWGVKDRDTFFHALVAVLRPIYGVLDVLLNDAQLGLFDVVRIPGSNGYTSSIVPLMEAFSMYNIKTQYQYREDINKEYDAILLDIINPIWDKVEDILNAPLQTLMAVLPNLALFIGNDGLCQILDNMLTPVSALLDSVRCIVDVNKLLPAVLSALNVDLNSLLGKIGVTNFSLDIYDLNKTLKPLLGGDAIIPLVNNILGLIKIKDTPLNIKLNSVDWLQLASHGKTVVSYSQAATYGSRIYVEGDSSETLIALLRYLINTINAGDNYNSISSLIGGLIGGSSNSSVTNMVNQVLGMLKGDTDEVIKSLVELLQQLGG